MIVIDQKVRPPMTAPGLSRAAARRRGRVSGDGRWIVTGWSSRCRSPGWLLRRRCWGHGIGPADVLLAAGLYTITGFGPVWA